MEMNIGRDMKQQLDEQVRMKNGHFWFTFTKNSICFF